jgi:threonine/homoserine/homoserine lactone efflux protein
MFESIELSALLISIIAGLFLGVPSGPALFFVLDTCLQIGKAAALKVYGGFMGAKLIYIALALLANDYISSYPKVESALYLAASFLLVVWGVVILFKSSKQAKTSGTQAYHNSLYRTGFIVGISNPVIPFVYLTFIQFIKIYARDVTIFKYLLNITIMEAVSFLVLAGAAWLLLSGGQMVRTHWNKLVKVMALFLIVAGSYQVYQLVDFSGNSVHINDEENPLEEQLEKVEEETQSKVHQ